MSHPRAVTYPRGVRPHDEFESRARETARNLRADSGSPISRFVVPTMSPAKLFLLLSLPDVILVIVFVAVEKPHPFIAVGFLAALLLKSFVAWRMLLRKRAKQG